MRIFCGECNNVVTDTYKQWMDHIQSDIHQKNIAEKVWSWTEEVNQRSVVITQKPNEKGEFGNLQTSFFTITWYFSKYGTISNAFNHPSRKFCIIQFEKRESVQEFLTTDSIIFEGVQLALRLKSALSPADWFKLSSYSELEKVEPTSGSLIHSKHVWLTEQIQNVDPDIQLEKLLKLLTMSEYDFKKREQVRSELVSIVKEQYPNAKLIGIGDVITGLGDSDSVLSLSFELPGASFMDSLIDNINRLMMTSTTHFKDVKLVRGYPAPYIIASHCTTDVKVQLWFNNAARVQSSKLIQFLISLDPRVLPLMILIRYWASYNFQPPNLMDTYTLDLLVIVYLNCMKILPNVAFLQLKSTTKTPLLDDFWNINFCSNYDTISEILSTSRQWEVKYTPSGKATVGSVLFLAKHFFRMYAKVNFRITFVCSLLGSFFLTRHLDVDYKEVTLPQLLKPYIDWSLKQKKEERFKFESAMCVQDPFNLSLNTASDVTEVAVLTFQNACYHSVDIFDKMLEDPSGSILNVTSVIDFVVPSEENNDYRRNVERTGRVTLRQSPLSSPTPSATVAFQSDTGNYNNPIIPAPDNFIVNPLAPLAITIGNNGDVDYRTHFSQLNSESVQPLMAINTAQYFGPQNNELGFNMGYSSIPTNFVQVQDAPHSSNNMQDMPFPVSSDGGFNANSWINPTEHHGTTNERWFQEWPPIHEAYNSSNITEYANNNSTDMTLSVSRTVTDTTKERNSDRAKKKLRLAANRKVKIAMAISSGQKTPQFAKNRGKKARRRPIDRQDRTVPYKKGKNSRFVSSNGKT